MVIQATIVSLSQFWRRGFNTKSASITPNSSSVVETYPTPTPTPLGNATRTGMAFAKSVERPHPIKRVIEKGGIKPGFGTRVWMIARDKPRKLAN